MCKSNLRSTWIRLRIPQINILNIKKVYFTDGDGHLFFIVFKVRYGHSYWPIFIDMGSGKFLINYRVFCFSFHIS